MAAASLELDAVATCATRADLIARVRARTPRVRFVDDGSGLAVHVQISSAAPAAVDGEVSLASAGAKPSVRRVRARNCAEAADAIALIIAVTLDPTASDARSKTTATADSSAAAAGASGSNDADAASVNASTSPKSTATTAANEALRADTHRASTRPRGTATFDVQLAGESMLGVAPGVMPSVAVFARAGVERSSVWSPSVVLGLHHAWRTVEEAGGQASFSLDAVTLDACPMRFRFGAFEARPCGSLLGGRMSASATNTLNPAAESHRPFWVVGGAGVFSADLTGLIELSGRLALGANLVRDSFTFAPATFYKVPPLNAAASVGVGVRWR